MLLLKRPGFELESTSPVVKAEVYDRIVEAGAILDEARAHAAALEREAEEAFERRKEEGYRKGLDEAREEMSLQLFDMVERSASYLERVEEHVVVIVMNSLKHILATLPPDEVIVQTVRKALASVMANQKQVVLRVAYEQVDAIQNRVNEILAAFPAIASIEVTADPRMNGTDCILETDVGVVEAGAEVQLRAIERALRGSLHREA